MHKDKPPGLFDFASHGVMHAVWVGLGCGFGLALLARVAVMIVTAEPDGTARGMDAAKPLMTAHAKEPDRATPTPNAAVDF